ncbi:CGI-121-domain-containing protein [Cyathus striatus]|nr:CGI-121-domain-containing protein [Cyathus striatus]
METTTYPHLDDSRSTAHIALFKSVENAAHIRKRIIAASTMTGDEGDAERTAVDFAFVDPRLVTSRLHLETAIHQSILADQQGGLRTKTVHSEVLWNLNPTNNITEAIRRYGVSDTNASLLLVHICSPSAPTSQIEKQMRDVVKGELVPLNELEGITDWALVRKYHKLNHEPRSSMEKAVVDDIVTSTVAMKSVMA